MQTSKDVAEELSKISYVNILMFPFTIKVGSWGLFTPPSFAMTQQAKIDPSTCLRLITHALLTKCHTESAIVSQAVCSPPPVNIATHPLRGQSQQPGSLLSTQSKDSVLAVQQKLLLPPISQLLTTVNEDTNAKKQPDTTNKSNHDLALAMAKKEYGDAI